jgi:DNA-binding GntR family transcriptional regulator
VRDSSRRTKVGLVREAPVARRSAGEEVADHIRQLVFTGELHDGERVPQREIAQALGVSSVPVREALASLQREGVVTIEPNRGAFINGLDADVVREQFYIFGRIYGRAARITTERAEPSVVAAISDLAERIGAERDLEALLALSIQFEMRIVDQGGSKRLRALILPFSRIVPGNFYVTIPGSADATRRGVAELAEAVASGRPDAAESACWRIIDAIGELVARRFHPGGGGAARNRHREHIDPVGAKRTAPEASAAQPRRKPRRPNSSATRPARRSRRSP